MQIKETMFSLLRAVWIALGLVAATESDEMDEEDSEPKIYEFEHEPVEGLVSLLKRSRVINGETRGQQKKTNKTENAQEGVAKKGRVGFHFSNEKSDEEQRLKDFVEKLGSEYEIHEKMYNERTMNALA